MADSRSTCASLSCLLSCSISIFKSSFAFLSLSNYSYLSLLSTSAKSLLAWLSFIRFDNAFFICFLSTILPFELTGDFDRTLEFVSLEVSCVIWVSCLM